MFSRLSSPLTEAEVKIKKLKSFIYSLDEMISFFKKELSLLNSGDSAIARDFESRFVIYKKFTLLQEEINDYLRYVDFSSSDKLDKLRDKLKERYLVLSNLQREVSVFLEAGTIVADKMLRMYGELKVRRMLQDSQYDKNGEIVLSKRDNLRVKMTPTGLNDKI